MKRCKHCGSSPTEYRDQTDANDKTFHVLECPRSCQRVVSYKSITNCRKKWNNLNAPITRREHAENIINQIYMRLDSDDIEFDYKNCVDIVEKYLEKL